MPFAPADIATQVHNRTSLKGGNHHEHRQDLGAHRLFRALDPGPAVGDQPGTEIRCTFAPAPRHSQGGGGNIYSGAWNASPCLSSSRGDSTTLFLLRG